MSDLKREDEIPTGEGIVDDSYKSRSGQFEVPVTGSNKKIDQGAQGMGREQADSDEQLAKDDQEAIDESNIIDERTRGASKKEGSYTEPGDEEGLPSDDGTSATR